MGIMDGAMGGIMGGSMGAMLAVMLAYPTWALNWTAVLLSAIYVVGMIGLLLPVLQGVLFLVIGLLILSSEYVWAHRLLGKLRQRFPAVSPGADQRHSHT